MTSALHFYLLAVCVGTVQGGAQALSRSIFARMIPHNKHAEFLVSTELHQNSQPLLDQPCSGLQRD